MSPLEGLLLYLVSQALPIFIPRGKGYGIAHTNLVRPRRIISYTMGKGEHVGSSVMTTYGLSLVSRYCESMSDALVDKKKTQEMEGPWTMRPTSTLHCREISFDSASPIPTAHLSHRLLELL